MDERVRKPEWLQVRFPGGPNYLRLKALMRAQNLHTVCEEAHCPNMGECWEAGTATFMILGDVCTRACGFCAVTSGRPEAPPDVNEPKRVAYTVAQLGLTHAVITSVNRDDQPDGGSGIFAETIRWIRRLSPGTSVEVLIPDFLGNWTALETVLAARPEPEARDATPGSRGRPTHADQRWPRHCTRSWAGTAPSRCRRASRGGSR